LARVGGRWACVRQPHFSAPVFQRELPHDKLLATIDHHGPKITLDAQALCADLRQTEDAFHALTGARLQGMWRPPGTTVPKRALQWAGQCGWPRLVAWDARGFYGDELPSDKYPNDRLLNEALKRFGPGTIVMMHLGVKSRQDPLAPTLVPLIQGLKARGMCFASLSAPRH
jgi:peptidoglycan-N-acetylmuramic acid deacetylase